MRRARLSISEARRIALAAQGFDRGRPVSEPDARHFRRALGTMGVLQLDYVNVLMPAHYLVMWSRLGPYRRSRFEELVYGRGEFTEQWAHEASIVPMDCWPLLNYRRRGYRMHPHNPLRKLRNRHEYLETVLRQVRRDGALTTADLPAVPGTRRRPGDWHRTIPRWALEYHFARGELAVTGRRANFQRVYDLAERVVPATHRAMTVSDDDARRELLRRASESLGIATVHDLADYFRMSTGDAAPLLVQLEEEGALQSVAVEGWEQPAYLAASARLPRTIRGASLLSPFDPVVWFRPRAERLFGFHYRIEIYVPAAKRRWGYYVLPFRLQDRIVARVDLKADRRSSVLRVQSAHAEERTDELQSARALATELRALADWLELDAVRVARGNGFSRRLADAV